MQFAENYSFLDRALHHLAFATPFLQRMLGELENDLYRKHLKHGRSTREVFVAGLPRSGTTLVLELLYGTGEFRTFTYREMPFILAPLLWRKISARYRKKATKQERAHGDGMEVSFDSPEAFEEIIWLAYLRDRIEKPTYLAPLSITDCTEDFVTAIKATVTKLLLPSANEEGVSPPARYLSKNNANLSRIEPLADIFPESTLLVPFRTPLTHVASMNRMHQRFLLRHDTDSFSRRYMKWLGHFEFGENFKPINFGGWLNGSEASTPVDEEFWMHYWIAAYRHVLDHRHDGMILIDFDAMLRDGARCLERVADRIGVLNRKSLIDGAASLRQPTTESGENNSCSTETWQRAQEVHAELRRLAI